MAITFVLADLVGKEHNLAEYAIIRLQNLKMGHQTAVADHDDYKPKREKRGEEKGRKGRERKVVWDRTIIYGHR